MKLFECQACGQLLYFENTRCERCGHNLGYLPDSALLSALVREGGDRWRPLATREGLFRFCANAGYDACNWLVPAEGGQAFCSACRHNRTIPDLGSPENLLRWQRLETAKHRLIYGLLRLGLPLVSKFEDPGAGLAFDFLADGAGPEETPQVVTGHARGLITINVAEADDVERERARQDMAEPYRTLLGHFRHEVGHYYWERLVQDGLWLDAFRTLFGDERQDYGACLQVHHAEGPPLDWRERFVSGYASAHPWEDFAETWAHYLHIVDTLETAAPRSVCGSAPRRAATLRWPRRSISIRTVRQISTPSDRGVAAARLCGQQPEPEHGPAGALSVRAGADRHGQAALRPWPDPPPRRLGG
jgi:hypothetical protein